MLPPIDASAASDLPRAIHAGGVATTASRAHARRRLRKREGGSGERALDLASWFLRSKYALMAGFAGELREAPGERDAVELEARLSAALERGERGLRVRTAVTVLLAASVLSALVATLARAVDGLVLHDLARLVDQVAAVSTSLSVVLVALRLACDRYLERVDVTATFLAAQLAASDRPRA